MAASAEDSNMSFYCQLSFYRQFLLTILIIVPKDNNMVCLSCQALKLAV